MCFFKCINKAFLFLFLPAGSAAAEWKLCFSRKLRLCLPATPCCRKAPLHHHRPSGGHHHYRLQHLVSPVICVLCRAKVFVLWLRHRRFTVNPEQTQEVTSSTCLENICFSKKSVKSNVGLDSFMHSSLGQKLDLVLIK